MTQYAGRHYFPEVMFVSPAAREAATELHRQHKVSAAAYLALDLVPCKAVKVTHGYNRDTYHLTGCDPILHPFTLAHAAGCWPPYGGYIDISADGTTATIHAPGCD